MDELKRDLREVFDRQQRSLGSLAGARERVLRGALATDRSRDRWPLQLAVGAIAVLLAIALVGTLVLARQSGRMHSTVPATLPSAIPVATPSASPTRARVANSVPVILYLDPDDRGQVDGMTWDGQPLGRIGTAEQDSLLANPTGTLYATGAALRDRTGGTIGSLAPARSALAWADDGRHYCLLDHPSQLPPVGGEPTTLRVSAPGQQARVVTQVGEASQRSYSSVAACSVEQDRAVVVESGAQYLPTAKVWVVQLSTGRILWSRSFTGDVAGVHASRDGQYVAVVALQSWTTTVYDGSGTAVAHLTGSVEAFSWDGTLAAVRFEGQTAAERKVEVVRWRDGTAVWTGPAGQGFLGAIPEPAGGAGRLAIGMHDQAASDAKGYPIGDVYAVGPDGKATTLARAVPF
jgi:hypothetical protein